MTEHHILKIIFNFLSCAFVAICIGFGVMLYKSQVEVSYFVEQSHKLQAKVTALSKEVEVKEKYLKRFEKDERFAEWLARKRLGVAKGDEIIFRFEGEK